MRTESDSIIWNLLSVPVKKIAELPQMPFRSHPNKFAALQRMTNWRSPARRSKKVAEALLS